ncbi:hypothetical protein ACBJ59_60520 [Nonomuraea sp. MTCD27]|uniref:hypothetical protein n=1 Tax=Nonomuraea sp. MTCD27 TaxID=1676747 RepID=UPI0035C235BF
MPAIEGRTKLAKLDFFLRYPRFLERAENELQLRDAPATLYRATGPEVEAPMIRYRFGPWDTRYRQFLTFLQARQLIRITRGTPEKVTLTAQGRNMAVRLEDSETFQPIVERCDAMSDNLARMSGTALKDLVYKLFPDEVVQLPMRGEIQ